MRPAEPPRRHCTHCNQEVYLGMSGYGPWCDLYNGQRKAPCRAVMARALDQLIADADPAEQASLERLVQARYGLQWRMEL